MSSIAEFLERVGSTVNDRLDALIPRADVEPRSLHAAIRWSVFAGGKRIRPALVFAAGAAFGCSDTELTGTAAAIEMIHAYSLIHDDLPAMDNAELRRGRATCHRQFGEATAILAGDALQAMAFRTVAEDRFLDEAVRCELIAEIAAASSTPSGMVSGQQRDLEAEGRSLSADELELVHTEKTGALIAASALAGAIVGRAYEDERSAIRRYAGRLGLLFQITDDLLDVTQRTDVLGKSAGQDAAADKATYPAIYGVERTRVLAAETRDAALLALTELDRDTTLLSELTLMVGNRER